LKLRHLDFGLVLRRPIETTPEIGKLGPGTNFTDNPTSREVTYVKHMHSEPSHQPLRIE